MWENRFNLIRRYRVENDARLLAAYYAHPDYAAAHRNPKRKWKRRADFLLDVMSLSRGENVLDVGCAGKLLRPGVIAAGSRYVSLDIAPHFAPDLLGDISILRRRPAKEFDWVVLSNILEHVHDPASALNAVFWSGNRVMVVVPHLYRLEAFGNLLPRSLADRHLHRMSVGRWEALIRSCGGQIERSLGFCFVPSLCCNMDWKVLRRFDDLLRENPTLQAVDAWLQNRAHTQSWMKWIAQEAVIQCRVN